MVVKACGFDIGSSTMKIVDIEKEGTDFVLKTAYTAPVSSKGMLSESPLDQEEMQESIKKALSESKVATRNIHIALPEHQVYTRIIQMPKMSDKELSGAIYWEAEQYIPVPLDSIYLDYKVLEFSNKKKDDPNMDVLIVGSSKTILDRYQNILTKTGLIVLSAETETLAIVRALVAGEVDGQFPPSVVVNMSSGNTSIAIVREGMVSFTYSIPLGGTALTRAIAADFAFSAAQAEEYKKIYGVANTEVGQKINKACEPVLSGILTEVKKAIAFDSEKYKEIGPLRQIVLCGGGAKLPGLNIFFAQNAGIESVIANPWKILVRQELPKEIVDNAPDYVVAAGLAIREYA